VIEINTGKSWESFVREKLLNPLQMSSTKTNHADFLAVQNKTFPHQRKDNSIIEVPFERLDVIAAGAGLSSNAEEMAKWLKFILAKNHPYAPIIRHTVTPQTLANPEVFFAKEETWFHKVFFPNSRFITYGMGWFIHDYKNTLIYQDPGRTDGMDGLMAVIPELNLGIVILSNLEAPFFSHSVLFHVIDYYRNEATDWNQILLDTVKLH